MSSTSNGSVRVAPGLVLDDALYTAAAAGVAEHVPDLGPLTRATWTSPRWTRIPDEQTGEAYKAELTLAKSANRTVKINLWFAGDVRDPAGPRPHNHPWDFFSAILEGTYVEHRWTSQAGDVVPELDVEHRTGTLNTITRDVYHEVTEVEPGRTLTLMVCGATEADWGYMDPDTGLVTPAKLPGGFAARLRELNPHQRPAGAAPPDRSFKPALRFLDRARTRKAASPMPTETPAEQNRTEHVEAVDLAEHAAELRAARAKGETLPAGRLLGLPDLPGEDVWVDAAGAEAVTGVLSKTITGWLSRGAPKRCPFPAPHRFLYRLYWPLSTLEAWTDEYRGGPR